MLFFSFWKIMVIGFRYLKKYCSFIFSIILAFAYDDRATTVDAICEYQTSWAFCKIYILVSTATRSWNTGNLLIGPNFQLLLCLALFFLISFFHFFCMYFVYIAGLLLASLASFTTFSSFSFHMSYFSMS